MLITIWFETLLKTYQKMCEFTKYKAKFLFLSDTEVKYIAKTSSKTVV